ncbi:DUF1499 domain-containing protein [Legionella bononiensis]|uniref:DUF1499 domain-containing protein n=1 Tax=Legionella bononiensis TaxID=2793102 RepID=A0ABS1W6H8_9GAMM|nr:DUF1499 domain-containing protein [Legionella bononiensis]MBL7478374.1 DUF1499 domain-containing protein [Legionella bononiensis]MBL7524971.1 DUF1499 domain-containing protein [Legionella bononiensis]MBL7561268.1 DUF1499 domain-containing protein [Legionella bononiensis]
MKIMLIIVLLIGCVVGVMYLFPQINFREMPKGLIDGQLPEEKPNWVSSLVAADNAHYIPPLKVGTLVQLAECIKSKVPEVTMTQLNESNLIGYRQSRVFHFVDWLIIRSDGTVVSSATMGHSDFGKNRELIERIRTLCS